MLAPRRFFSKHWKALLVAFKALAEKPFSSLATIAAIAITLALPALLWIFLTNTHALSKDWEKEGYISLYLQPHLSSKEIANLLVAVEKTAGVKAAELTTAEEGLQALKAQEGMQDILLYLPENPLPAVIHVYPELLETKDLDALVTHFKSLPSIDQVKLDRAWVKRFHALLYFTDSLVEGLVVLLSLAVLLIIGNTLRLAIQDNHNEIKVLKLIGASDAFIARPFLYAGFCYGFAGALGAVLLVYGFMLSLTSATTHFFAAYQIEMTLAGFSGLQWLGITGGGAFLGWLSACLSVQRQLASIEPHS